MKLFRELPLENGLVVNCYDESRHYFGEYHLARVVLTIISGTGNPADSGANPGCTEFRKVFERMGVHEADLPHVTGELVDGFLHSALPYLNSPDFPGRLRMWSSSTPSRRRPHNGLLFR